MKLIIPILLITLVGCSPSLKERQSTHRACVQKHLEEMNKSHREFPLLTFYKLCTHNKIDNSNCLEFIAMSNKYGRLQEEVNKFVSETTEQTCGKYPTK